MPSQTKDTARFQDPKGSTHKEVNYRQELEDFFPKSIGTNVEKLQNFAKYVPRQTMASFLCRYEIFKHIQNVQGSIVECGVLFGGGLMSWAHFSAITEPVNWQRNIIGFDTFEGFSVLSEKDKKTGESSFMQEGALAINAYEDIQECVRLFDANRFLNHVPKVKLVKGDACKTIPKFLEENPHTVVSLLYLDMDVYEPTKVAIEQFLPRMPKGSVIVFDELNTPEWPGETLAVLETLGIRNLRIQRFPFDTLISYAILD